MAAKHGTDKEEITGREMELMAYALKSIKGEFVVDYEKFAVMGGFKNKSSASVTWGRIKRKLDRISSDKANVTPKSPSGCESENNPVSAKKTGCRKRKANTDEDVGSSATKISKKRRNKVTNPTPELSDIGIKSEPIDEDEMSNASIQGIGDGDDDEI